MIIKSEQEMIEFGREFARGIVKPAVIELVGDVGAGKTTFTKGLAEGLGVQDEITSPSFTISKVYKMADGGSLVHYDFYRLPEPGLMVDDLTENLENPNNVVVIEWGESVADLLPENHKKVEIVYNDEGREVTV